MINNVNVYRHLGNLTHMSPPPKEDAEAPPPPDYGGDEGGDVIDIEDPAVIVVPGDKGKKAPAAPEPEKKAPAAKVTDDPAQPTDAASTQKETVRLPRRIEIEPGSKRGPSKKGIFPEPLPLIATDGYGELTHNLRFSPIALDFGKRVGFGIDYIFTDGDPTVISDEDPRHAYSYPVRLKHDEMGLITDTNHTTWHTFAYGAGLDILGNGDSQQEFSSLGHMGILEHDISSVLFRARGIFEYYPHSYSRTHVTRSFHVTDAANNESEIHIDRNTSSVFRWGIGAQIGLGATYDSVTSKLSNVNADNQRVMTDETHDDSSSLHISGSVYVALQGHFSNGWGMFANMGIQGAYSTSEIFHRGDPRSELTALLRFGASWSPSAIMVPVQKSGDDATETAPPAKGAASGDDGSKSSAPSPTHD